MKKKIPVRYYEKVLPSTTVGAVMDAKFKGTLTSVGGTLYIVKTI